MLGILILWGKTLEAELDDSLQHYVLGPMLEGCYMGMLLYFGGLFLVLPQFDGHGAFAVVSFELQAIVSIQLTVFTSTNVQDFNDLAHICNN